MTDRGLLEGFGSLHGLKTLRLAWGWLLSPKAWSTFLHGPSMTSIVLLNLSSFKILDDEGLDGIAERYNKLKYLQE
jgi:hypothetical protein